MQAKANADRRLCRPWCTSRQAFKPARCSSQLAFMPAMVLKPAGIKAGQVLNPAGVYAGQVLKPDCDSLPAMAQAMLAKAL